MSRGILSINKLFNIVEIETKIHYNNDNEPMRKEDRS